jgi:hypothetical protein
MKTILLKLLLFAIIVASIVTGLILSSDYVINKRKDYFLKTSPDTYFVFAGNSTVECSVDDRLIDHSINIAQAGEAYLYSYAKIKALLKGNKHIRYVFISYSYADLLIEKEESWLLSDYFMVEKVQYYHYLLDKQERLFLIKSNPAAYLNGVIKSVVNSFETVTRSFRTKEPVNSIPNFGGYKRLVRDKLDVDPGIENGGDEKVKQSTNQIRYLVMISELCQLHSVKLVLFNPPKHKSYNENVDPEIKQLWLDVRNSLPSDSLLDLSGFLMADSCYGDLSHLNYRGAKVFSLYLNEILHLNPNED